MEGNVGWTFLILAVLLVACYRLTVIYNGLSLAGVAPRIPVSHRTRGPLVSILVPARNEAHQIAECLHSILAQTYDPFEVLVVDDASERLEADR